MNKEEISNLFINTIKSCQQIKINSKHYNNIIYFIETDKNTLRKMKLCKLNDQKFNNNQTKGNCVFAINLDVTDAYYKLDCNYTIFDIFKNKYFKLNNIFYNEKIIENMIKSILNENKIFVDINISFCNFNQQYFNQQYFNTINNFKIITGTTEDAFKKLPIEKSKDNDMSQWYY